MKKDFTQTKSELHTHLMGMLSAEEFFKLIIKYSDNIYWPIDEEITENSIIVPSSYLNDNQRATKAISIPRGKQEQYKEKLKSLYRNRSDILGYVIENYADKMGIELEKAQYIIYSDYFNRSLSELINNGIEYTEISFANEDIIRHLVVDDNIKDKIKFTFLLCTRRDSKVGPSMQEKIKRSYESGIAIGFDFMGFETPIDEDELDETSSRSYYRMY